jgi:hypothetical protein
MSEMDSTINRLLPLLYTNIVLDTCADNVIPEPATEDAGLFARMMRHTQEDEDEDEDEDDY